MKEAVILKSSKYGIQLKLNPELPFSELMDAVVKKFQESESFFQEAHFAVSFDGRSLTDEEEFQLVSAINDNTGVSVICIMDEAEVLSDMATAEEQELPVFDPNSAYLRYDSLTEDEVMILEENVVIMGDVPESATISATGSVIVLGSLRGKIWAGSDGNEEAFVFALHMHPASLRIAHVLWETEEKSLFRRRKKENNVPRAARITGDHITVEEISTPK